MVTSTLSDFWFLRRSTCKNTTIARPQWPWHIAPYRQTSYYYIWLYSGGARDRGAHPFGTGFVLCPEHIPAAIPPKYKMRPMYAWWAITKQQKILVTGNSQDQWVCHVRVAWSVQCPRGDSFLFLLKNLQIHTIKMLVINCNNQTKSFMWIT
jgi:hypothetical protein